MLHSISGNPSQWSFLWNLCLHNNPFSLFFNNLFCSGHGFPGRLLWYLLLSLFNHPLFFFLQLLLRATGSHGRRFRNWVSDRLFRSIDPHSLGVIFKNMGRLRWQSWGTGTPGDPIQYSLPAFMNGGNMGWHCRACPLGNMGAIKALELEELVPRSMCLL